MREIRRFLRMYQSIVLSVALLLVAAAGALRGIVPAATATYDTFMKLGPLGKEVDGLKKKLALLQSLDEESLKNQIFSLYTAVPYEKNLQSIFFTLEGVASKDSVVISDFSLTSAGSLATESAKLNSAEEKRLGVSTLAFTVTVDGSIDQVKNFLSDIVAVRRFLRVTVFDVVFAGEETARAKAEMLAFYSPNPASLGKATDPLAPLTEKQQAVVDRLSSLPSYVDTGRAANLAPVRFDLKTDPFSP